MSNQMQSSSDVYQLNVFTFPTCSSQRQEHTSSTLQTQDFVETNLLIGEKADFYYLSS